MECEVTEQGPFKYKVFRAVVYCNMAVANQLELNLNKTVL